MKLFRYELNKLFGEKPLIVLLAVFFAASAVIHMFYLNRYKVPSIYTDEQTRAKVIPQLIFKSLKGANKMNKSKIIKSLALFIIVFISITLCCCKPVTVDPFTTTDDPFAVTDDPLAIFDGKVTLPENYADETAAPSIKPLTFENCPDDSFYSMTTKEAYEKYGILGPSIMFDWMFDGEYTYGLYFAENGNFNSATLGKREYPNGGEWTAACTDPLCSHKAGSGCPFYNCGFEPVYYEGNIYFATKGGSLCVYDKNTNKSTSLIKGCYNSALYKYDGSLYFIYSEEDVDFESVRVFIKILPDSKTVELGRLEDVYIAENAVYSDRYAIDYKSELTESGGKISVLSNDLKTKEVKTITEIECPGAVMCDVTMTRTIYGDKLFLETRYYMTNHHGTYFDEILGVYKEYDSYENDITDVWLVDLKTGEKRFICSSYSGYISNDPSVLCSLSSKCVMWNDKRQNESDPFTVHILFPYTGEEEVYDISDIVKKETGDTLPLDTFTMSTSNSAVVLKRIIDNKVNNTYEIDLESRNVYKYDLK